MNFVETQSEPSRTVGAPPPPFLSSLQGRSEGAQASPPRPRKSGNAGRRYHADGSAKAAPRDPFDAAPVGFVDLDDRGYIRRINRAGAELLEASAPEDLVGKAFVPFVRSEDIQKFVGHLGACFRTDARVHVEVRLRSPKEAPATVYLSSVAARDDGAAEPVCRTVLTDLTARLAAEETAREQKDLFRIMTDTAPVLVWMADAAGLCIYLNQTWLDHCGRTLKEELGNGWLESIHPDDREPFQERFRSAFAQKDKFTLELRLRRRDGEFRWFLNSGLPRFSASGVLSGFIGTCVDISERREAEELRREILEDFEILVQERTANLKRANQKLRREVFTRKRLEKQIVEIADLEKQRIGNDLHDGLGQQLTGVAFLSKVLEQKLAKKSLPEQSDAAQVHSLVSQSLSYTRELARGLHVVELRAGGLKTALSELRAHVENLFSIKCHLKCDPGFASLDSATSTHVFRIAQEAVNNAVKHGNASQIEIALSRSDRKRAVLEVRDDGVGIPQGGKAKQGMGMHTMRYRTEMIRGVFEIRRGDPGGAVVVCSFPLASKKNAKP